MKDAGKLGTGPVTDTKPTKETKVDAGKAVTTGAAPAPKGGYTK